MGNGRIRYIIRAGKKWGGERNNIVCYNSFKFSHFTQDTMGDENEFDSPTWWSVGSTEPFCHADQTMSHVLCTDAVWFVLIFAFEFLSTCILLVFLMQRQED